MKKRSSAMMASSRITTGKDYNNKSNNRNLQNRKYPHNNNNNNHHRHPENSNITGAGAKRLTLQSGFVYHQHPHQGIKSERDYSPSPEGRETENFFIKPDSPFVRRSCRLCSKETPLLITSASSYYENLISTSSTTKSKSIFKEINEKFIKKTRRANETFSSSALNELACRFQLQSHPSKPKSFYQDQVIAAIRLVNEKMSSNLKQVDKTNKQLQLADEMNKENIPVSAIKFPHVPQCNWVFQTPPNRKLKSATSDQLNHRIQPAVVDANKVIYEMKNRVNVDLTHFSNKQEVNIDKRYMMEVSHNQHSPLQENAGADELENHFLSLTCRPKKTVQVQSKIASGNVQLKRKRDIFEMEEDFEESFDEFDANFTLINNENQLGEAEESFTFQFTAESDENNGNCSKKTATKSTTTTTTGHFFDFAGNKKDSFHFQF